ncbi:alpha/beta fold hydrolase [Nocardia sp. NPDC004260]
MESLCGEYRCIAIDLPLHGETPACVDTDFSLPGLALFVADCCDALGLDMVNIVANDTGGAVAQIFATSYSNRVRTLTLTNCEIHDETSPREFISSLAVSRMRSLAPLGARALCNITAARSSCYSRGFQDVRNLPESVAEAWLRPLVGKPAQARQLKRFLNSIHVRDLRVVNLALRSLHTPTLIVWGAGDVFFQRKAAYWLARTIPGTSEVIEVPGGRLYFPFERSADLTAPLRRHLIAYLDCRAPHVCGIAAGESAEFKHLTGPQECTGRKGEPMVVVASNAGEVAI